MDIKDILLIENTLDLYGIIAGLSDRERIAMVTAILENIEEEGTIETIREAVNNPKHDD